MDCQVLRSVWSVSFQALLGGGEENFYKNIAVAMMPSTQGIYSIVVFFSNIDGFATDPYTVSGKSGNLRSGHVFQRLVSGNRLCRGHQEHPGREKHHRQRSISGAMPETYAVFALVMTFIMK